MSRLTSRMLVLIAVGACGQDAETQPEPPDEGPDPVSRRHGQRGPVGLRGHAPDQVKPEHTTSVDRPAGPLTVR